jgi:hypothetical protein
MKNSRKTTMEILKVNGVTLTPHQANIVSKLDMIPNGTNASITYKSDKSSKISAAYSKTYKVIKYSTFSFRKGIDYNNKKSTRERRIQQIQQQGYYNTKPAWYEKFDNTVARSKSNPNALYLLANSNTNANAKGTSFFEVITATNNGFITTKMSAEELKQLGIMQNSFWNSNSSDSDFRTLKLDDVLDVYSKSKR